MTDLRSKYAADNTRVAMQVHPDARTKLRDYLTMDKSGTGMGYSEFIDRAVDKAREDPQSREEREEAVFGALVLFVSNCAWDVEGAYERLNSQIRSVEFSLRSVKAHIDKGLPSIVSRTGELQGSGPAFDVASCRVAEATDSLKAAVALADHLAPGAVDRAQENFDFNLRGD